MSHKSWKLWGYCLDTIQALALVTILMLLLAGGQALEVKLLGAL